MADSINIGHLSTMYHTSFTLMGTDWLEKADMKANWHLFGGGHVEGTVMIASSRFRSLEECQSPTFF